jgi:hypothetical protein
MLKKETEKYLNDFAKYVIQQSRSNLTKGDKNVNKNLYNSLDKEIEVGANSFRLAFLMEDYGKFQDKGVSGIEQKYNTPFSYKSKGGKRGLKGMPPPKAFDKWNIKRGLAPRDEKGKFLSRKQTNFLVALKVFKKGIKPSLFFTKPFEKAFERLPDELIEAYGLDVEQFLEYTINKK